MKKKKQAPYIFLAILFCVFLLILGVNIGKRVEQRNKDMSYQLTNPPTKPVTITPTAKPLMFETYTNDNCGIQFLYPSSLTLTKESSISAEFQENKKTALLLNCDRVNSLNAIIENKNIKSEDISLLNKDVPAKVIKDSNQDFYIFRVQNPLTRKGLNISIAKTVYPIFRESFQFIQGEQ